KVEEEKVEPKKESVVEKTNKELKESILPAATKKTAITSQSVIADLETSLKNPSANHYAALAGFGKKSSALSMIQRLKKYKIDLELKTKVSKSASGKGTRTWYQVVTNKYPTRDELDQVIDKIVSLEHIKRK